RRGRPSTWAQFDEATAVLAGDALLAEAFRLALSYPTPFVARELIQATLGMIGGQHADTKELGYSLEEIHRLKTGRLFYASIACALWVAELPEQDQKPWRAFADELGMLFQVVDDILDGDGYVLSHGEEGARRPADEAAERAPARLVAADRRPAGQCGSDRQPRMVALVDQPTGERPHGVAAEAAAVQRRGQEEVDVGVLELVLARLGELCQPDHLALVLDRERGRVVPAFGLVEQVLARDLAPPAGDLGLGADLGEPLDVAWFERPQAHPFTVQVGHDRDHKSVKKRVDVLLVERGLAESRTQAQALLIAGRVPGHEKPGEQVDESTELAV